MHLQALIETLFSNRKIDMEFALKRLQKLGPPGGRSGAKGKVTELAVSAHKEVGASIWIFLEKYPDRKIVISFTKYVACRGEEKIELLCPTFNYVYHYVESDQPRPPKKKKKENADAA